VLKTKLSGIYWPGFTIPAKSDKQHSNPPNRKIAAQTRLHPPGNFRMPIFRKLANAEAWKTAT
jgi:hypothetical protein